MCFSLQPHLSSTFYLYIPKLKTPKASITDNTAPPSDYIFRTLAFLASLIAIYIAYRQLRKPTRTQVYDSPGEYEMTRGL